MASKIILITLLLQGVMILCENLRKVRSGSCITSRSAEIMLDDLEEVCIASPRWPNKYPNFAKQNITVSHMYGGELTVDCTTFKLRHSKKCKNDALTIAKNGWKKIFCGLRGPRSFVAEEDSVLEFLFESDKSGRQIGYKCTITAGYGKHEWCYSDCFNEGLPGWAVNFDQCAGEQQSPIDINSAAAIPITSSSLAFNFNRYDVIPTKMKIENSAFSVKVSWKDEADLPSISGGGLVGEYEFLQYHFHWGSENHFGSEHTVDGEMYPLELHLVHWNKKYATVSDALGQADGLSVLGVLWNIPTKRTTVNLPKPLVDALPNVMTFGSYSYNITAHALQDLLPADTTTFWRYAGSLTTPPCNEAVTWTVFQDTVPVSEEELEALRALQRYDSDPLEDNFRPPQPLYGRQVFSYTA